MKYRNINQQVLAYLVPPTELEVKDDFFQFIEATGLEYESGRDGDLVVIVEDEQRMIVEPGQWIAYYGGYVKAFYDDEFNALFVKDNEPIFYQFKESENLFDNSFDLFAEKHGIDFFRSRSGDLQIHLPNGERVLSVVGDYLVVGETVEYVKKEDFQFNFC